MPEIKQPDREISFKEKFFWTAIVLVIYLFMSQIPIYGVTTNGTQDPFFWLRVILASNRGSLTELGIGPIVTAGLIMQLLQGSKLIKVDLTSPEDRALFTGTQKVMAIALTVFQIIAYLLAGAFGTNLNPGAITLIFLQLLCSGIIIILLDEVIQKGWGIGSGVSLFIAAGVAGQMLWSAFSFFPSNPVQLFPGSTTQSYDSGAIIAFFQSIANGRVIDSFNRPGTLPTMTGVIITAVIFFIVVYMETVNIEIPLQYSGYRGFVGKYPIKLMYVSNIPVILAQALYANVLFFGQLLAGPNSAIRASATGNPVLTFVLNLLGSYPANYAASTNFQFTGGLIYYLTPPRGIPLVAGDPLHAIIYFLIFMVLCVYFGQIWVDVSGLAPRDIAQQILDSGMSIPGFRKSAKPIERILKRYIPTLTILCGMIVAILAFTADAFNALGTGTGILLTVGIMHNYAEQISKEAAAEQYPALRGFLGLD
ncbi:MAG TPA: preprotein translocase subunit SecY [Candidatus Lokiarchaeia archaeon]|nr:preprotein translocase subunit SecY [Candidatus Lokiarchaeia archaeon]